MTVSIIASILCRNKIWPAAVLSFIALFATFEWLSCAATKAQGKVPAKAVLQQTLGTVKFRNSDVIGAISVSPSGKLMASAGGSSPTFNYAIHIWNLENGQLIEARSGHTGCVNAMIFLSEEVLISCSSDGTLRKWSLGGESPPEQLYKDSSQLTCMSLIKIAGAIAIGTGRGEILTWSLRENKVVKRDQIADDFGIALIACAPSGTLYACDSRKNDIILIDSKTQKVLRRLHGHQNPVESIDFSSDSRRLVSTSYESIRLWDLDTGEETKKHSFKKPMPIPQPAIFSNGGKTITAVFDNGLFTLDHASLDIRKKLSQDPVARINALVNVPSKGIVIAGGWDRFHYIVKSDEDRLIDFPIGHVKPVGCISFALDDKTLWSGCLGGNIVSWDLNSGKQILKKRVHEFDTNGISFVAKNLFVSSSSDKSIALVRVGSKGWTVERKKFNQAFYSATSDERNGNGNVIVASDGGLFQFESKSGELAPMKGKYDGPINIAVISPSGDRLALAIGQRIMICESQTGKVIKTLTKHDDYINSIAYSSNGEMLASAARDGTVIVWDLKTGKPLREYNAHRFEAKCVTFFSQDRGIISGGWDGRVRFWNLEAGEAFYTLEHVHHGQINVLSLSHDGMRLAVGEYSGLISVWDVARLAGVLSKKST